LHDIHPPDRYLEMLDERIYSAEGGLEAVVLNSFLIFPGEDLLKLNHFTHCFV